MKTLAAVLSSLGSFFALFAVVGAFAWIARKASVLLQVVKH